MFAIKLGVDGSVNIVTPHETSRSIIEWLYAQIGGYIDAIGPRIQLPFDYRLIVNDKGKNMRLPHNERASSHMHQSYGADFIAGDCIIVKIVVNELHEVYFESLSAEVVTQLMRVIF